MGMLICENPLSFLWGGRASGRSYPEAWVRSVPVAECFELVGGGISQRIRRLTLIGGDVDGTPKVKTSTISSSEQLYVAIAFA